MHTPAVLEELVLVFGAAVVVVLILGRLRLPTIAGFIIAGALVGPSGLSLIDDAKRIEPLAEVGVALLLFTIGLELSPARLKRLWKVLSLGGSMQVVLTIAATLGVAVVHFGAGITHGVFLGFLVAMSSTAIVLRALNEKQETDTPHGRIIVGVLVFQDLCVVPMMLAVPMLAGRGGDAADVALALGKAFGIIALTLILGRIVLPRVLSLVARTQKRELFLLGVLLACSGIAWVTSLAGLSLALGAFLAGIALADSEYGHQAMSDVLPFREALTSLFFVSVGMLFDIDVVLERPLLVLGLVAAVLVGKTAVAALAAMVMRFPLRVAIIAGIGVAQIGEFSFVLARAGADVGLIDAAGLRLFIAMSVITMVVTPIAFRLAPHLAAGAARLKRLSAVVGAPEVTADIDHESLKDHVIIAGYGTAGRMLAETLRASAVPYKIVEINPDGVRRARDAGEPAYYGDITSDEILHHLDLHHARELVILINDPDATRRALVAARRLAPDVVIAVRTQYVIDVEPLKKLGATDVIVTELETARSLVARVMAQNDLARDLADALEQVRVASKATSTPGA